MIQKTFTKYICEVCGSVYDTENEAKKCERLGYRFKEYENKYHPKYCWYVIKNSKTKTKHILYVTNIEFCSDLGPKCTLKSIKLITQENGSYEEFILLSSTKKYNIVEVLNVEKCYEKYGIIPKKHVQSGLNSVYKSDSFFEYTKEKINDIMHKEIESKIEKLKNISLEEVLESNELKNYLLKDCYLRDFSKIALRGF